MRGKPVADLCPGHLECGMMTHANYTAAAKDATKECRALYFGLDCLDQVRKNCSASQAYGLYEAIKFARLQLDKLNCSFAIPDANGTTVRTGMWSVYPGPTGSTLTTPVTTTTTSATPSRGAGLSCQASLSLTTLLILRILSFFLNN
ncbi:uncharacterized protein [Haliotis asinina]